jgi:hypothetical protein
MSLEELTLGELRRALANGLPEETIHEALARLDEADEDAAQPAQTIAAYQTYVSARAGRLRAAVVEAVDQVDQARQRTGYSWSSPDDRAKARHTAGLEAQDNFLDDEPLLEFADWGRGRRAGALPGDDPRRPPAGPDRPAPTPRGVTKAMAKKDTNPIPKLPITQLPSSPPAKPIDHPRFPKK